MVAVLKMLLLVLITYSATESNSSYHGSVNNVVVVVREGGRHIWYTFQ